MLLNLQRILVALIFLFATLYANYWFTVIAYPRNIKSNTSGNLYSSKSGTSSSDHGNNLPTLHNITNYVFFTGEVNASILPNLFVSKPAVSRISEDINGDIQSRSCVRIPILIS